MKNYFELFQIEQKYYLDMVLLNQKYLAQQVKYHPDKANEEQKTQYKEISATLNKAYGVLKDDFERAKYLLSLNGIILEQQNLNLPSGELTYIWDQWELINNTNDLKTLKNIQKQKIIVKQELKLKLCQAFTTSNFQDALDIMIKFKYLISIINNIESKIRNAIT
ncbi:MAG: Fe-S protein assembly co-chaperone HscB [Rickettsiaceae bacterium]|nr:MAG: Fe-S protein assembly co-chaperone HscB [Rickettsiaceae bacterium]